LDNGRGERTSAVADKVRAARVRAVERGVEANAALDPPALEVWAPLTPPARALLEGALWAGHLSGRGLHRVQRVARTIADLAGDAEMIDDYHVAEALALRSACGTLPLLSGGS
jgi:magnesium chelatase family protein